MPPGAEPVVVGIGADDDHRGVVDVAADEAVRLRTYLRLVHAYSVPPSTIGGLYGYDFPASFEQAGEALLDRAAAGALASHPGLDVRRVLERGTAPALLEEQSRSAQLVVVGQDLEKPLLARMHEGRAATHLARHSHCPVLVVPSTWTRERPPGDVVAVLDTEHPDHAAHDYAAGVARDRGLRLRIESIDLRAGHDSARTVVEAVRAARDEAELIVIGQGPAAGWSGLRGSLGHTVVPEATCPVVICC